MVRLIFLSFCAKFGLILVTTGSVFDSPDLITVVVVGDGESETAATATAFSLCDKFLDPVESGGVISILHVNGFKISERTVPGTMDNTELSLLYSGHGNFVPFVLRCESRIDFILFSMI
jgi:xylulose-5-phosphate/fructose-6-phosphate phosphoketolase